MFKYITHSIILLLAASCLTPNPVEVKNKKFIIESMADSIEKKYSSVKHINVSELPKLALKNTQFIYLDARSKEERDVSTIYGSITKEELKSNQQKYKNHTIITFCTIGERSSQMAQELSTEGFNVYNLKGGVLAWAQAGKAFHLKENETKKVHVYSEAWNFLPKEYTGVFK